MAELLLQLIHGSMALIEIAKILREDPRIAWALAVLIAAGSLAAFLIRRTGRDELLNLPAWSSIRSGERPQD